MNPAGLLHVMVYSNASFARPDLKQIAQGGWVGGWVQAAMAAADVEGCFEHLPTHQLPSPCSPLSFPTSPPGIKMVQDRKQPIRGTYY